MDTAVALDAGFMEALESLCLTPAPVGDGEITEDGSAVFPITGGNVTYFEPGVPALAAATGACSPLLINGPCVRLAKALRYPGRRWRRGHRGMFRATGGSRVRVSVDSAQARRQRVSGGRITSSTAPMRAAAPALRCSTA